MSTGDDLRRRVADLLEEHGQTFAEEAGVRLRDTPGPLYQLVVVSMLSSIRIRANIAVAAARELFAAGWRTPARMAEATWQQRIDALGRAHYVRYDESTSTALGKGAELILDRWSGDLRKLRAEADDDPRRIRELLQELPRIGPVGAEIFCREAQGVWPRLRPTFDKRAMTGASKLGLPTDASKLAALVPDEARRGARAVNPLNRSTLRLEQTMNAIGSDVRVGPSADRAELAALGRQLRVDSIRSSTAAGSGHPSSSMSAADLMAVLMARHLRYDWDQPDNPANDHFVLSKGHASPLLYAMFKAAGVISDEELMTTYRRGGRLQGHPTPILPWVDVATGSLGQGICYGVGIALAGRKLDSLPYRVWTLCGDSEMAEGSAWEALDKAAHYGLDNFTAIIDVNRLGQVGPTEFGWDVERYAHRATAFGCRALTIDGHDVDEITAAYEAVRMSDRPTVIIARTIKGSGFSEIANRPDWHGKPLPQDMADRAIEELGGVTALQVRGPLPSKSADPELSAKSSGGQGSSGATSITPPQFEPGEEVATRKAFGQALAALGARSDVVALDGEVGNSTYTESFEKEFPHRFFQMYIAEQQMIATAVGLGVRGYRPFAATFAAFLTRAHDFLRMTAISQVPLCLAGSHCGVEIGADGPSQMGLEDLAMMRSLHGSTVLYPSDATSAAALTLAMADLPGISYLRTTRGAYPVLYGQDETFPIGGSKVWGESPRDLVTLVGAGVTLHECLSAAAELARLGVPTRVIDLYSVKPIGAESLRRCAQQTQLLVVVEDHHPEGGIGEAVAGVLAASSPAPRARFAHLAVDSLPGSYGTHEALDAAGISAEHIVAAVRRTLDSEN